jgi:3-hydroxybutyrate dehydrogenase
MGGFLAGRSAVITGSTSGLGLAMARAFAAEGCAITFNGFRDAEGIEAVMAELEAAHGVAHRYDPADLSDGDEAERLLRDAEAAHGGVDILANNAGVEYIRPLEDLSDEDWDRCIAVNVTAAFRASRAALPGMKARGWGRIVNTASALGLVGTPNDAPYVATKHALVGLTKVIALETAEDGITCNAICPGWIDTEFSMNTINTFMARTGLAWDEGLKQLVSPTQPSWRLIDRNHIAALALFLCSDAASQITGAALPIDGAWTAK